ncbi:hypothetical protein TEQG_05955 [Trichophyton equinum CBS 127.97]|uniref:Protein kinase domain-containing protein n=1 Tax=Trichophyton equinum (strain ATCC MYA-4606 / CBS 127.97) TaxID=559882 RepID=F2PYD4_TRIEC|nr:hypothetical protein TEQG_05955 [Trichophyton equinum CBS 127.97]
MRLPIVTPSDTSKCETYTVRLVPQKALDLIGVGASGQVYNVNDQVVLKTCRIFQPPGDNSSQNAHWHYASDTIFHSNLLKDERTVLQLLQSRPHRHIIAAVDTEQPEGLYLRKYRHPTVDMISDQAHRIRLYSDITASALYMQMYGSTISFSMTRAGPSFVILAPQVLVDNQTRVFPDLPLPLNGPSTTLSDASDMFAMASLIFQMEHGAAPELSFADGALCLPEITSGNRGLDEVIQKAWLGHYSCTSEMLQQLNLLNAQTTHCSESTQALHDEPLEHLKDQVKGLKAVSSQGYSRMVNWKH